MHSTSLHGGSVFLPITIFNKKITKIKDIFSKIVEK